MRLRIQHETRYDYAAPPRLALQRLRLGPPTGPDIRVVDWAVALSGAREEAAHEDGHGNPTRLARMVEGAASLVVTVTGDVETRRDDGVVGPMPGPPRWLYRRATALTAPGGGARSLAAEFAPSDPLGSLHALTRRVREAIGYRVGATSATTTAEDALRRGAGVCQDHAHAFLAAARLAGVPARYVSGYLRMDDREEQDAMHAWAEAWVEGLGWVGFDPANGHSPDGRYVAVARGLDYRDAAPVSGLVRHAADGVTERDGRAERVETLRVALRVIERTQQQQHQQ